MIKKKFLGKTTSIFMLTMALMSVTALLISMIDLYWDLNIGAKTPFIIMVVLGIGLFIEGRTSLRDAYKGFETVHVVSMAVGGVAAVFGLIGMFSVFLSPMLRAGLIGMAGLQIIIILTQVFYAK
jgi:hypothetical protein